MVFLESKHRHQGHEDAVIVGQVRRRKGTGCDPTHAPHVWCVCLSVVFTEMREFSPMRRSVVCAAASRKATAAACRNIVHGTEMSTIRCMWKCGHA